MSETPEKEITETEQVPENETAENIYDRIRLFFEQKQQLITYGGAAVLTLIAIAVFIFIKWLPDRNLKAQKEMFRAELAFAKDSFNLALNGGNGAKGFLEIGKKYSFTKAANLSNYYSGLCYLNLKQYDNAIKDLKKFNTSDPLIKAAKFNAIGDAYAKLGKLDEACNFYKKAVSAAKNDVFTPYYLFKT
ncbi:MAG: tetratricopeptide repeat protein, partial [Chitinophagales bacterium]|nr:tetratricopeptide repeat protein [Chitinophagales bacterium]